ncbi:MAG: glycosyltransferase family 2 protein, partial [Planctomycetaceae bacterium]
SIVIPVMNEEETLPALYDRLTKAAPYWNCDYEVIVIDDGSTDASAEILSAIHREDPRWKVLHFSRNFGHQPAVSAGIHYSRGDAVVVMDADLQDPPEELGSFLDKWREGYQVVYAIRTKRKENVFKRSAYALFYRLLKRLADVDVPLDAGDFCVMDRSVVKVLAQMPERTRFVRGLRSWAGFRQAGVAYERHARHAGDVKYTFSKLIQLAINGILSFSGAPLRLASWLGILFCGLSIGLIAFLVGWWATDLTFMGMHPRQSAGWTSMVSLILFVSGLNMLLIGVVGEYLARVFDEVKGRPPWVIATALGFENEISECPPQPVGWFVTPPMAKEWRLVLKIADDENAFMDADDESVVTPAPPERL